MMNFSFFAVPIAWGLAILPHFYAMNLYNRSANGKKWDNTNPRGQVARLQNDSEIPEEVKLKIIKAEAAQQNGFENLAFFCAGLIAANVTGVPTATIHALLIVYLISRAAYNLLYINTTNFYISYARTLTFLVGVSMVWAMFILAGQRLPYFTKPSI
eukprot:TRINITY_DN2980_c0_g1_i1.p1 TRINITY_DN2980_c0_g1~~TRINITY_DN2980_c0_g1_i1.p1  ORF type:complete len:157 (+),score=32.50 TRINITY_DN2980_c0_g1_i1:147-617(+)